MTIHYVVVHSSIKSYNAAQVGEIFGHWKIFSIYLHWLGIWDIECHHLCLLQVDPQTYLFRICIKMVNNEKLVKVVCQQSWVVTDYM